MKWVENDDVLGSTSNKDRKTLADYFPYAVAGGRWQVKKVIAFSEWGAKVAELAI